MRRFNSHERHFSKSREESDNIQAHNLFILLVLVKGMDRVTRSYTTNLVHRRALLWKNFSASFATSTLYTRLSHLAVALKSSPSSILKEISINHKKKIFCKYDGRWFKFATTKDVIVPFKECFKIATKSSKDLRYFDMENIPLESVSKLPRTPVIAILGHFDHGKTTLLDALGGTSITADEAHGITQVVRSRTVHINAVRTTFVDTPGQEIFFRMRNYGEHPSESFTFGTQ